MDKQVLLLGVGNILLGDEGFGVHALRRLEEGWTWPENVKLLDGGTLGLMLMAELMECDLVVILDIVRGGGEPGSFYRIEDFSAAPDMRQSMHQTSMEDVLISCGLAGKRPEAVALAMEPYDMQSISAALTPQAEARLEDFCRTVIGELAKMGINAAPRQGCPTQRI